MKKLSNKQKNSFVEIFIDFLVVFGIILIFSPWLKDSLIGWQIQRIEFVQQNELPKNFPAEEKIEPPRLSSIVNNFYETVQEGYGVISIPSVGFEQPLLVGITNQNLLRGGAVMYSDREPTIDNFVVLGHHLGIEELLFGKLMKVKENDQVFLSYMDETKMYEVKEIRIVDETDLSVLENDKGPVLTLITCPVPQSTEQRFVVLAYPLEEQKQAVNKKSLTKTMLRSTLEQRKQVNKLPIRTIILIVVSVGFIRYLFYKKNKEEQSKEKEH